MQSLRKDNAYSEGDPAPIVDVRELKEMAKRLGVESDDQQELALQFFHLTGKIRYLKHVPRLSLSDEEYKRLADLVILAPHWLMSMMRVIVELVTIKSDALKTMVKRDVIEELSTEQRGRLKDEGIADYGVLEACWRKFIPPSNSPVAVTTDNLCLIFKAYCLIHPLASSNTPPIQEFLIPSILPDEPRNRKNTECYDSFYFDFNGFLPDVVYHRLLCFMSTASKPPHPGIRNYYSKQECFFAGVMGTNFVIEKDEPNQRLKIKVLLKEPREKTLHDYLFGIHEDFLFKICEGEDSSNGLKGLEYYGGPEVTCSNDERRCEWKAVIPCVRYQGGVVTSKVELLSCDECGRAPNIQEWLPDASLSAVKDLPLNMAHLTLIKSRDGKELYRLIERVSTKWRKMGTLIDLEQNILVSIDQRLRGNVEQCWLEVMQKWLDGQGRERYPTSWEGLCSLLVDIGSPRVAQELKDAVAKATY